MKHLLPSVAALLLLSLVPACQHQRAETAANYAPQTQAMRAKRLQQIKDHLDAGELYHAQRLLAPMLAADKQTPEALTLAQQLEDTLALQQAQRRLDREAMHEVEQRLSMPHSYGRTVVIEPDANPFALAPPGPMEELLNRRVSMRLHDAGIKEVIMTLSEIDGLNIIADEALSEQQRLSLINVRDVPLYEILSYVARNMGIAFHLGSNTIWVTESQANQSGPELEVRLYQLRHGQIPTLGGSGGGGGGGFDLGSAASVSNSEDMELVDALEMLMVDSPDGAQYQLFSNRNVLLIKNSRAKLQQIQQLLDSIDHPPKQVLIEARFVTVAQNDLLELGVSFSQLQNAKRDYTINADTAFAPFTNASSGANVAITGIVDSLELKAILHAFAETGSAKTLSAPRITVMNNRAARIRKGDKLYYFEDYSLESTGGDNPSQRLVPSGSPTELELGISLDVKPTIGQNGKLMLALRPQVKEFISWLDFLATSDTSNNNNNQATENLSGLVRLPKINENALDTTISLQSGETVILGGMMTTSQTLAVRKVPLLGDLPLIGALFRHRETSDKPQHLLIFVTATLVEDSGRFLRYGNADANAGGMR